MMTSTKTQGLASLRLLPEHYQRFALMGIESPSTAAGRRTLVTPELLGVTVGPRALPFTSSVLDLDQAASWDSITPDYTVAANRAGKDFYLYATPAGLILSANSTVPAGFVAGTSRKVGGFHCLCLSVGTIAGHLLSGFLTGDILPASIWDLNFRPICSPEGMVYSATADIWVDIYLQSGTAAATRSIFGATITDTRTYWDHGDDLAAVGKRMLFDMEFSAIAYGSPEATSILGSADPVTTGGHANTASRRIISDIGCEDCTGALQQWIDGGLVYRNDDAAYAGAFSWKAAGGRGQQYTQGANGAVGLLAGGAWANSSNCGSRSRTAGSTRTTAAADISSRGCSRSRPKYA